MSQRNSQMGSSPNEPIDRGTAINDYGITDMQVSEYFTGCRAVPRQETVGELNGSDYDE